MLISAEQGLGDTLQFCRYLPLLEAKGARVILAVQGRIREIVKTLSPTLVTVAKGEVAKGGALPAADYHCWLMSLPLALGTRPETVPAKVPYLHADAARVEQWKRRIGGEGFRIGIAWQGRLSRVDSGRSFAASEFVVLSKLPNVRLISLQKNLGAEQLARLPAGMQVETLDEDYDSGPDAFLDTAAVMMTLDLVISADTAIAHLAGALGRPVWAALKYAPDWRWLLDRSDTPWYPTMRLFRQRARGDWKGVFQAMAKELTSLVHKKSSAPAVPVQAKLKDALARHQDGDLGGAEKVYRDILAAQPDHFDSLHLLGVVFLQTDRTESAVESIAKAIALNPGIAAAHDNLGTALKQIGRFDEAVASYDRAIALEPTVPGTHYNRGNTLRALGRPDEAIASYDKALALQPGNSGAYLNRGNAFRALNRHEEAIASYDKAIGLKPDYAMAFNNRGNVLKELRRLEDAAASYAKAATALMPDYADAYYNLGNALSELRRYSQALASYEKAIALQPERVFASGDRLHTRKKIGDWANWDADASRFLAKLERQEKVSAPFPVLAISDSRKLLHSTASIWTRELHPANHSLPPLLKIPPAGEDQGRLFLGRLS